MSTLEQASEAKRSIRNKMGNPCLSRVGCVMDSDRSDSAVSLVDSTNCHNVSCETHGELLHKRAFACTTEACNCLEMRNW